MRTSPYILDLGNKLIMRTSPYILDLGNKLIKYWKSGRSQWSIYEIFDRCGIYQLL